jgi:hypothetical protein
VADKRKITRVHYESSEGLLEFIQFIPPIKHSSPSLIRTKLYAPLKSIFESTGPPDKVPRLSHASRCALRQRTHALNHFLESGTEDSWTQYLNKKAAASRLLKEDAKRRWKRRLEQLREAVGGRQHKRVWTWMNNFMKRSS